MACGEHLLRQLAADDPRRSRAAVAMATAERYLGDLDAAARLAQVAIAGTSTLDTRSNTGDSLMQRGSVQVSFERFDFSSGIALTFALSSGDVPKGAG